MTNWLRANLLIGLVGSMAAVSAGAQPVEIEGQKFEPTVQIGGQTLNLNGVGLRRRAIFKVYVAGLYVPQKSTNAATLINDKGRAASFTANAARCGCRQLYRFV